MPQARLPDVNTSIITYRTKITNAIEAKKWSLMKGYLNSFNGTLPPEYRVIISSIEYNKIAKEDYSYVCQSCAAETLKEEIVVFNLLPNAMERLIYEDMPKKVWICTKCYSIPNELTKTIIKIIKLQNPSFIGVVPDPPDKKRGITDRLQFDVDSEYWGLNLLAEIEERLAKFRDDHWNKGDNEDDIDLDTSTEESEQ